MAIDLGWRYIDRKPIWYRRPHAQIRKLEDGGLARTGRGTDDKVLIGSIHLEDQRSLINKDEVQCRCASHVNTYIPEDSRLHLVESRELEERLVRFVYVYQYESKYEWQDTYRVHRCVRAYPAPGSQETSPSPLSPLCDQGPRWLLLPH